MAAMLLLIQNTEACLDCSLSESGFRNYPTLKTIYWQFTRQVPKVVSGPGHGLHWECKLLQDIKLPNVEWTTTVIYTQVCRYFKHK